MKKRLVQTFLSYRPLELNKKLSDLGIQNGDSVLLHSSFSPVSGFRGSPAELIDVFLKSVGRDGNLLMVSLPYRSSSFEYLQNLKCFDVRKTVSQMGLVSEIFRRRKDVVRSLHPTHPMLACGPKAEWIVADHEECLHPCGAGTPFEKLAKLGGKVCFFDAAFATFTFFHYLEDLVSDRLPFPLYVEKPFSITVIDVEGQVRTVKTQVFSPDAIRRRRFPVLEHELRRRDLIKTSRIGNTRLELIEANQAIECTESMASRGVFFYEM